MFLDLQKHHKQKKNSCMYLFLSSFQKTRRKMGAIFKEKIMHHMDSFISVAFVNKETSIKLKVIILY